MNARAWLSWSALALHATWCCALSQELAALGLARFAPDLGLALFTALAAALSTRELPLLALVFALARVATTIDPPFATLAGALAALLVLRALRSVFDLTRRAPLALCAAAVVLGCELWLTLVVDLRRQARFARAALDEAPAHALFDALTEAAPAAGVTALLVFGLAPWLRRLPGLPAPEEARTWPRVVRRR